MHAERVNVHVVGLCVCNKFSFELWRLYTNAKVATYSSNYLGMYGHNMMMQLYLMPKQTSAAIIPSILTLIVTQIQTCEGCFSCPSLAY